MALDPAELRVIADWFQAAGRAPTDVELETLAQTWSEHCAHKTFRAAITLPDGTVGAAAAGAAARRHRRPRRAVRAQRVRRQRRHHLVRARHHHRGEGRDAQPPVGHRAVRRRQHRRRRRDPRRDGRRAPPHRHHRRAVLRPGRPAPRRRCRPASSTHGWSARASSPAWPTTATRSGCPPWPAPCCTTRASPPTRWCSAAASAWPPSARR